MAEIGNGTGRLIIHRTRVPEGWGFSDYNNINTGKDHQREMFTDGTTRIAYKQNRTIIFQSKLFHETDRIEFREGYTNRRINLTLMWVHMVE